MISTNPNPNSIAILLSNKASMAAMYLSSPAPVHFRSILRPTSGLRTLTRSVSGFPVVQFGSGLVYSNSNSRNRLMISSAKSTINVETQEETEESEEVGKQTLVSFEETTLKFTASQEAFEVYYRKKSMVKSKETSKKTDNTRNDLNVITLESIKEGNVYTFVAEEKKDIIEQFASSTNDLKDVYKVHEFYFGIPYWALLSLIGFFSFMITGNISSSWFGTILGSLLLASSGYSFGSWRNENPSVTFMKGQAAILSVLFLNQARLVLMRPTFTRCIATLVSTAVLSFYLSRIVHSIGQTKLKPNLDT